MQVGFEDLTRYFQKPPALSDMVFEARDTRRGKSGKPLSALPLGIKASEKNDILIIVPSYHDNFRLGKLLRYLEGQTFKNFDVAIIFAKDDKFVSNKSLSLYQVKRNIDAGFAGSVYLGQLLALREGYKYYIFTDVDRVPHTSSVLSKFHHTAEKSGADYVFGNNLVKGYFFRSDEFFDFKNPMATPSNCVFSLIRTSTLHETGLYALPLYIGYEDVEFEYRLKKATKSQVHIDELAYESYNSPAKNPFLKNFGGQDMGYLYIYPTMLGIYNFPQSSNHLGFFREFRVFFIMLLAQKFSALRIPGLAAFEENAKKCRFAKTYGKGVSSELMKKAVEKEQEDDYENYTSNALFGNALRIFKALIFHVKNHRITNYSPLFEFFINDSFYVYDEVERKTFVFEWRRKPGTARKLLAASSALFEATCAAVKARCSELAGDRGMFHKYGLEAAE